MPNLDRLADRELGAMETLFVKGDEEVLTRSTVIMLVRLDAAVDYQLVVDVHERASRAVPHLRRRIVAPVVPISRPYWVVDPDFDVRYHVRHVRLPGSGTESELRELAESLGAVPVDPARPLWELTVISGLADGTTALLYKLHHAIADGHGLREILSSIFEADPDPGQRALPPLPAAEDVTRLDVTRQRLGQLPLELVYGTVSGLRAVAGRGVGVLRHPRSTVASTASYLQSMRRTMSGGGSAPPTLMGRRGPRRKYATMQIPLPELRAAGRALSVSLNSVYVSAVVEGVTRYHEKLGASLPELAVSMPVSVRRPDDKIEENRFVGVRIAVPASGTDLRERAEVVSQKVRAARDEPALEAFSALAPAMSMLPLWLTMSAVGGMTNADLQVSNVPGLQHDTYISGVRVAAYYGFAPLAGAALMVVMTTSESRCDIALNMDADAVTEPELMHACFEEAFADILRIPAEKAG